MTDKRELTQEDIDARKIHWFDVLNEVFDLDNCSWVQNMLDSPGLQIEIPVRKTYSMNQAYKQHTAGARNVEYKYTPVTFPIHVDYNDKPRLLVITAQGPAIPTITVWPKNEWRAERRDPEDNEKYCRECGEEKKLAYLSTNASCDEWKCQVCGNVFQWPTKERD